MTVVPYDRTEQRSWLTLQNPALELANAIAGTEFVPSGLRNNPAAITAAILYGDEVGLGPMQSLAKIAVINGRPTLAAEAQRALILRAGHDLWVEESTNARCIVAGRRRDSEATSRVTWTLDDAKRAKLAGKPPWQMYPRQMLLARASAELARAVFPDAIGGLAATEELDEDGIVAGAGAGEPGPNGAAAEAAPTTRRRRRSSVTAGAAPHPPSPAEPAVSTPDEPPALPPDEQALVDALEQTLDAQAVADAEVANDAADAAAGDALDQVADELAGGQITELQRRKMHAIMREKGVTSRDSKIAYCNGVIGRTIESSNDLTREEAGRVIDHLEQYDPENLQTYPYPDGF